MDLILIPATIRIAKLNIIEFKEKEENFFGY